MKVPGLRAFLDAIRQRANSCSICGLLPPQYPWGGACVLCHDALKSCDSAAQIVERIRVSREAWACAALMATCPTPITWALCLEPEDGEISIVCQVCNETLKPLPGNRRGDGGMVCPACPAAQWEAEC
jgi:hypothetical protein